ncbi:MAG TPA: hypothetical protein VKX49_32400 [Bryobacteraceae bacterium]|nr:hypothetical protein [Bryobacteraceae bacterium]
MLKTTGMFLMLVGVSSLAFAVPAAPEIGGGSAASAIALIGGAILVLRSRK